MRLLRDAFWRYRDATGQSWMINVLPIQQAATRAVTATPRTIRIELTDDDAEALAAVLDVATDHSRGGGLRVGGRGLSDTSDVAARLCVRPSTVRGWLSRGGPKGNPFPAPDRRYHGRSYWKKASVDEWMRRQEQLQKQS